MRSRRSTSSPAALVGAALFATIVNAAPRAHAQAVSRETRALADEHIRIGVADYSARLFTQAAQEFEVAYGLNHDPLLLSNIGNARYEAGEFAAARDAFREYLARVPNPPNRAVIEQRLQRSIDAIEAEERRRRSSSGTPTTSSTAPVSMQPPPPGPSVLWPLRIAGIAIGAAGVIAVGVGAGLYVSVDAFYRNCEMNLPAGCAIPTQPRALDAASVALLWGGGVLAVGGALLAILAPRPQPDWSRIARHRSFRVLDVALDPSSGAVNVRGEF